jgi:CubicO group peptidase (beta-lactamase class C family)
MLLNGGVYEGKRYLSEAAFKEMTSNHTGEMLGKDGNGYGLCWSVGGRPRGGADLDRAGTFGHGGAYSTNMEIDMQHGLVTIYMVQHAGYAGKDGDKILPEFHKAALAAAGH